MKKCYCCGAKVPDEARFCPKCGKPMEITQELLDRAKNGDGAAFEELYNRTCNAVYSRIKGIIGINNSAVEDLTQETYTQAYLHMDQLQDAAAFPGWILTIARNQAVNWYKKYKRETEQMAYTGGDSDSDETLSVEDDLNNLPEYRIDFLPGEEMDRAETSRLVNEILDSLTDYQRTVLILRFQYQMSIKEIAEQLGTNQNTVKSRLYDGQRKVEAKVKDLEKQGTKLYSMAPLTFLLFLLRNLETDNPDIPAGQIFERVQHSLGMGSSEGEPAAQEGTNQTTSQGATQPGGGKAAAGTAAKSAAKATGGAFFKTTAGKVVAAVVAVALVGGGAAVYTVTQQENEDAEHSVVQEEPAAQSSSTVQPEAVSSEVEPELTGAEALADADIEGMLDTFDEWVGAVWYRHDQPEFSASLAVEIAAEAYGDVLYWEGAGDEYVDWYEVGTFLIDGEPSDEGEFDEDFYGAPLNTDSLEDYLSDLFGAQYTVADFETSKTGWVAQGNDGQLYYGGEYINEGTDFSVTSISDAAVQDGSYTVRVRYVYNSDTMSYSIFYVDYQLLPDSDSAYGCIITGMEQVGTKPSIIDEEDADTADVEDWAELYADYLETGDLGYIEGWGYCYLIYLNDDDVPELLYHNSGNLYTDMLFYIRDGQVYAQQLYSTDAYAEHGGYITGCDGRMGGYTEELYYLDDDCTLTEVFHGNFYAPDEYTYDIFSGPVGPAEFSATLYTDEEEVGAKTEAEYLSARAVAYNWANDGEHTVIMASEGYTDSGLKSEFGDAIGGGTGPEMVDTIEYLRAGPLDDWEQTYVDYMDNIADSFDGYMECILIYLDDNTIPAVLYCLYDENYDLIESTLLSMQDGQVIQQEADYDWDDNEWLWLDDVVEYESAYVDLMVDDLEDYFRYG